MPKSVPMHAVLDGSDTRVGSCHPAKARILVKDGLAKWKGKRVYLTEPDPTVTVATGGVQLTMPKSEWDSLSHHMEGPHVHWKLDPDFEKGGVDLVHRSNEPWPGLKVVVMKNHFQQGGIIELDSKTRSFTKIGFVHAAIPKEEWYDRVTPIDPNDPRADDHYVLGDGEFWHGKRFLVDGEPWDPYEHLVTSHYDNVRVHGFYQAIEFYRDEIPKHWSIVPEFEVPETRRANAIVKGALEKAIQPCGCAEANANEDDPTQHMGCSECDNHHVRDFNELYSLYINGSVHLDTMLGLLKHRNSKAAREIVDTYKERARASWMALGETTRGRWVERGGHKELVVQTVLTDPKDIAKVKGGTPLNQRGFAPPPKEYLDALVEEGVMTADAAEHISTQARCPNCGIGIDTDGDGNCPICTKPRRREEPEGHFDHLFDLYQKGSVGVGTVLTALSLPDAPESVALYEQVAALRDKLDTSFKTRVDDMRQISRDLPIFQQALGDLCGTFELKSDGFSMSISRKVEEDDGWHARAWVEVRGGDERGYTIYVDRFWKIESPDTLTGTSHESAQEVVYLYKHYGGFRVNRLAPTEAIDPNNRTERDWRDYTSDDWEGILAGELRYIRETVIDPEHAPKLVDQPEIVEGLPTHWFDDASDLYMKHSETERSEVYTCGNVGFGFTDLDDERRYVIGLAKFKQSAADAPKAFTEAMKTHTGRCEWFNKP